MLSIRPIFVFLKDGVLFHALYGSCSMIISMMEDCPKIAIVLSTYNGQEFLHEQLNSILNQSYNNFIIVARDDSSSDNTKRIIGNYANKYKDKFHILPFSDKNLGPRDSFSYLIEYVLTHKSTLGLKRAYIALSDQDDIWETDKIHLEMLRLVELEKVKDSTDAKNSYIPALIHSDLSLIDEGGSIFASSFIDYQGIHITGQSFLGILLDNTVTGCTAVFNEELANLSLPFPQTKLMHDWWLAIVAIVYGNMGFINKPLVRYRQHQSNVIGANRFGSIEIQKKRNFFHRVKSNLSFERNTHLYFVSELSKELRKGFHDDLNKKDRIGLWVGSRLDTRIGLLQTLLYRILVSLVVPK